MLEQALRAGVARQKDRSLCAMTMAREPDSGSVQLEACRQGGYLHVRASVFLTKGDRTSRVEGTHQVLPGTGEISAFRCSSSFRTHRPVNFRGA